jgi:hypothetical protein
VGLDHLRQLVNARIADLVLGEVNFLDRRFHGLEELVGAGGSDPVPGQLEGGRVQRRD